MLGTCFKLSGPGMSPRRSTANIQTESPRTPANLGVLSTTDPVGTTTNQKPVHLPRAALRSILEAPSLFCTCNLLDRTTSWFGHGRNQLSVVDEGKIKKKFWGREEDPRSFDRKTENFLNVNL